MIDVIVALLLSFGAAGVLGAAYVALVDRRAEREAADITPTLAIARALRSPR